MKCATFVNSVNKLIANYGNVQQETLNRLFNIYCCTFYGAQLWNLNSKGAKKCYVTWNKAVRRILHVSARTHTWMLAPIIDQMHIKAQIEVRTIRFMYNMLNSDNKCMRRITCIALAHAHSTMGLNYSYLLHKYDICIYSDLTCNIHQIRHANELTDVCRIAIINNVKTLIDCKTNNYVLHGLTLDDINDMLNMLTTGS